MSAKLRVRGNAAFNAGRPQEALDMYYDSLCANPKDYALLNNISLIALQMGKKEEVGERQHAASMVAIIASQYMPE